MTGSSLRDREGPNSRLVLSLLTVPHPDILTVAIFLSAIGAGLQVFSGYVMNSFLN
jgi:hypothetical protein